MQKSIKNLMHLGIDFWKDFGGFWEGKWNQVGTKIHKKIVSIAKRQFFEKLCLSLGKTNILKVRGVQVGSKNRLKIDQKMKSTWEGILESFFNAFWWIFGSKLGRKMEPRSIQKGIEKRFFEKSCSRCSGGSIFEILGVEVGSKNRLNINQKMKSTWEGILASIFHRFWWILGGK